MNLYESNSHRFLFIDIHGGSISKHHAMYLSSEDNNAEKVGIEILWFFKKVWMTTYRDKGENCSLYVINTYKKKL